MALKTFVAGEVLTAADTNLYLSNTIAAIKAADESVTSSITLQDDDHLTMAVAANSTYEVAAMLLHDGAQSADMQTHFVGPAGATLDATVSMLTITATTTAEDVIRQQSFSVDQNVGMLGAATTTGTVITGILVVGGTAGTFKLQWAQVVSSGTPTRMFAKSYIVLRRIS